MAVFGIICETNPIHNGHKYLLDRARDLGADKIVCIMSGNTVQRGEFAVADKYSRAEILVKCGADMVVELPFPWCSSSAESFALAGIKIASNICDTVIFGSECGDIDLLSRAAHVASADDFKEKYLKRLSAGEQAAAAYRNLIKESTDVELSSNDTLGIEYMRAAIKLGLDIKFETVGRVGDGYLSGKVEDAEYPSATAIRNMWSEGRFEETKAYIPEQAFDAYKLLFENNSIAVAEELDAAILLFFRLKTGEELSGIVGAEGGLANRFCEKAKIATTVNELIQLVKNKRYTDGHIKRFMLHCIAGVTAEDISLLPCETLVLAVNKNGRELLSCIRKKQGMRFVTKPADMDPECAQNVLSSRIDSIYSLAHKSKLAADVYVKMKPYIE